MGLGSSAVGRPGMLIPQLMRKEWMRQNVARQDAKPRKSKGLFSGQGIGRKASIPGGWDFKNAAAEIKFKHLTAGGAERSFWGARFYQFGGAYST
jgi:hypothetical protein